MVAHLRGQVDVGTVDASFGAVLKHCRGRREHSHLQVLIVIVEAGDVEPHPAIEQVRLQARFVSVEDFRLDDVGARGTRVVKIGRESVGKECVSTCRSRWSPTHSKTKKISDNHIIVLTTYTHN